MRNQLKHTFKWVLLVLIFVLMATGCSGTSNESATPTMPPTSAVTEIPPTSAPTPTESTVDSPTLAPPLAPEPTPEEHDQSEHEHVLYESDFTELDERWPLVQEFDNSYYGFHEPEWYHVEVHAPNDYELVTLKGESYEDITTEVDVFAEPSLTEPEGDFRYGLVFRRVGKQWYGFVISPKTQSWWVLKSSPTGLEVLKEGEHNSIQGLGAKDTLRLDAEGSDFYFHINDQFITQVSDGDYESGEVGFFVETFDSPKAHIHYDFLSIREVEPPQFMCDVIAQALNLRSGPSTIYNPPIANLTQGDQFEPLERTTNGLWIWVRMEGSDLSGWVANSPGFITCNVAVSDLPESQQ